MDESATQKRVEGLFEALDAGDIAAYAAHFAADAVMSIGERPPLRGREAIERGNRAFLGTIAGLQHRIEDLWSIGDTVIVRLHVRYALHDGGSREIRTVTIFRDGEEGIEELEVFFGSTPTFTGVHE